MWAWVSPILDPTQTQYVDPDDPSLIQIKAPQRSASCLLSKIVPDKDDLNFGYDAHSGDYKDMVAAGILDPIKVVRVALQDAASVAGLLITTDAMVADRPEPKGAPARARCGRHQSAPLARGFRQTCMGLFLSSGCFGFCSQFFVRSGKGRSSSRRLRSGSRSARKGSRDRNASELGGVPPERRLCFAAP